MTESLDQLQINLNPDQLVWINICLAFLMFGVALDIDVLDFKKLMRSPRALISGLISQWILLPALTFALVWFLEPHPGIALGMLLVAACPGGNMSNFLVHLAEGNRALSVTLTSFSTLFCFIITPFNLLFWGNLYPPSAAILQSFSLSPLELLWILVQLVGIPLVLGMFVSMHFPAVKKKIKMPIKYFSMLIFLGILAGALIGNLSNINYLKHVFFLVFLHNALAYAGGFFAASVAGVAGTDRRTIMLETGIQNSGLGLIIIFNFYGGLSSMALVAAWWAIWHLISGFSLSWWWGKNPVAVIAPNNP